LKLFVCGPTVYDYSHIGHARTYLVFDSFVRYLKAIGFRVFYLQNITDVDDKIISRAKEEGKSPKVIAEFFEEAYRQDMKALDIESVDRYARASDFIPEIVRQVKTLLKKGYAYKIEDDGFYFDVSKFKNYGKLSKRTFEQAEDAVSRIDESVRKINKADFALWKFPKKQVNASANGREYEMKEIDGEPAWNTELGWGRPGWHIEDTAITEKFFGPQYDMHGGAVDLKFPHHEAEIAQQEAASGKTPFVKIWMHTGFLLVGGEKMSKSLKNFITIRDFLKKYSASTLRWLVLSVHYRSPLNFSWELAEQAAASIRTISTFLEKLDFISQRSKVFHTKDDLTARLRKNLESFEAALADDFNTPAALAEIFSLEAIYQKKLWEITSAEAKKLRDHISGLLKKLGFIIEISRPDPKIIELAEKRELLRINKQFIEADALRREIKQLGYEIEDTPLGPFIKKVF
jgi:cysteinyl-tRNA synthetase